MAKQNKKAIKDIVESVVSEAELERKKIEEFVQLVAFELDDEEYAVPITDLVEIIKITDITPIPNSPEFIRGIFNLRGKIVVVVDLEKRFSLLRENKIKPEHIIISKVDENTFGVIVDKVREILKVPVSAIQKAPALVSAKIHSDFIDGVVVLEPDKKGEDDSLDKEEKAIRVKKEKEARLLILIDLPKMLAEKELLELGETTRKIIENVKK